MKTTKETRELLSKICDQEVSWRSAATYQVLSDLETLEKAVELMRDELGKFIEATTPDGCGGFMWRDDSIADCAESVRSCLSEVDRVMGVTR